MKRKELIKRLLLGPLDWVTLTPFAAGAALAVGGGLLRPEPALYVASGAIAMLLSTGVYLHRLIFGWEAGQQRLLAAWTEALERARQQELDALYRELQQDGDPRTETLLKDLRTLTEAIVGEQSRTVGATALDIASDVDVLFQRSVDYLKESLGLWRTAAQVHREPIRAQLLAQREILIAEVEKSIENLGEVLGGLKRAAVSSGNAPQLAELRDELRSRLRIAEEVEQRLNAMRSRRDPAADDATYLEHAETPERGG